MKVAGMSLSSSWRTWSCIRAIRGETTRLIPGYYADLNIQYQLTDTAGFYVGSIFQGAGSFKQTLPSGTDSNGNPLNYSSTLDFGSQEGVKGGMTVRF